MLTSITWTQYLVTLITVTAIYYAAILLLFYRKPVASLIRTGRLQTADPANAAASLEQSLQQLFRRAAQQAMPQAEVVTALQFLLRQYSMMKGTTIQSSVNRYIQSALQNQFDQPLTEPVLNALWG